MSGRKWFALIGLIVIAAMLAFPLRNIVYQLIVVPLAYILWALDLVYLILPQAAVWILLTGIVLYLIVRSLAPEIKINRRQDVGRRKEIGAVESLAASMKKSERGIYFKWLVANRLGKLAYQMLLQREHGKPRSVFASLEGDGWHADPAIRSYLEQGLHGSFADYPAAGWNDLSKPQPTSLDLDVREAVEFLESKVDIRAERS